MKTPSRDLSFRGINFYIGIDVHLRQWTVTIRTQSRTLRTFSMDPDPLVLIKHLWTNYPHGTYYSVYEAGFCGFWIHRKLVKAGIHNIVVNPADIPTSHKEKVQKRDKRDSQRLARELANGSLQAIYIPSCRGEALRSLGRRLAQNTKDLIRIKTRIKHFLHTQGVPIVKHSEISHWSAAFIEWLKSLTFAEEGYQYYLAHLLEALEFIRYQRLTLVRHIRHQIRGNETIKKLRTVPGVGFTTAFIFYVEIQDMNRFPTLDRLDSYIGLVPAVRATDDKEHILGLSSRANKYLRHLIIEAAWVATRIDPVLTLAYEKQLAYKPKQKAIIRIAKKLVSRMRYVWINNTEYVIMNVK